MTQFLSKTNGYGLRWIGLVALVVIVILTSSTLLACAGLKPEEQTAITVEFIEHLTQQNATALDQIRSEMDDAYDELYATEEKLLKLEQVIVPATEWVESEVQRQKARAEDNLWVPSYTEVPQEEFSHLQNDQYWVTTIELISDAVGTPDEEFVATIKITDLTADTWTQQDWETIEHELETRKTSLEQEWQSKLEEAQLARQTILEVTDYWETWEIQRINSTTYTVSGTGLGWAEGLTSGQWTYHKDSKEIIPADDQSIALSQILLTEF